MSTPTGPPRASIRLRAAQFRRYAKARGITTDREIAAFLGLERTSVFRMLRGDFSPGERSIAAMLAAFPDRRFEDFFEIVTGDEPGAVGRAA